MDFNAHMRNTAYLDRCGDVRMMYFAEHGFEMREFQARAVGPVILKDEIEYFRELHLLDRVRVTLSLAGTTPDADRWRLRNEFFREDGKLVARVTSAGGWLDLNTRTLVTPPDALAALILALPRTDDFAEISRGRPR